MAYGIIFDMDGVIALSNDGHFAAWRAVAASHFNINVTRDIFNRDISGHKSEEIVSTIAQRDLSSDCIASIVKEKDYIYRHHYLPYLSAVPGVIDFINTLSLDYSNQFVLALATSAAVDDVKHIVSRFDIEQCFNTIITGVDVTHAKPDPSIYLLSANRIGLSPSQCIVFEDSKAGVTAAKNAGMKCIGVTTSESVNDLLACGADAFCHDFNTFSPDDLLTVFH